MAGAALMEISMNEDERAIYLSRKKAENDRYSEIMTNREIGRRAGFAEGEARAMRGIAKKLKAHGGMTVEEIAKAAGLSVAEVNAL